MDLKELQRNWDELGKADPLWAILSSPEKLGGKWGLREFFRTGQEEIARVMQDIDLLRIPLPQARALDFGCGVGRLTQALCQYFEECCGVDIAPSMIKLAEGYNRYGSRCRYYLYAANDLRLFGDGSFDFVYTNIVLQHMRPEYSKSYIKEFLRILRPGGVLIFQIPSESAAFVPAGPEGQPAVSAALPDSAFRAQIRPHQSSLTARAAFPTMVQVTVKNVSNVTWPRLAAGIALGGRWLDESGRPLADADGRSSLSDDLGPTEEAVIYMAVNAPTEPGNYILELDMVQETVAWFKDKGSETAQVRVRVTSNPESARADPPGERPRDTGVRVEMYGVRQEEVLELIAGAGGKVVDVRDDLSAGPEWISFRYCVIKG